MKPALVVLCVSAALCATLAGSAAGGGTTPTATRQLAELDQEILSELNRTRIQHGLQRLVLSNGLQKAAGLHSRQMLDRGFFAHDAPGGLPFAKRVRGYYQSNGYSTWSVGENLLYSTGEVTAEMAVKAWLDSPEHRRNMLSPDWREVGVASVRASAAGGTFGGRTAVVVTMDFGVRSGRMPASRSTAIARSTAARTGGALASLAVSSRPSARVAKPKPRAKNTTTRPVTRVLPGGQATQTV